MRHVRSERRWKGTCAKTAPPSRKDASSGELGAPPGNGAAPEFKEQYARARVIGPCERRSDHEETEMRREDPARDALPV